LVVVDEHLSVVRLVHYTTQEYLDSIQPQQFPEAQIEITRSLLTFISSDDFWDWDILHPLLDYSQYCLIHAVGPPEHQLRGMILEFLGVVSHWNKSMRWKWDSPPWNFSDWPSQPATLWIAVAANLLITAKYLLEGAPCPRPSYNPEMCVASFYGHLEMLHLLVEYGADVNSTGGIYGFPLQAASLRGHLGVVRWLTRNGADVHVQGGDYGSALQAASFKGHQDIIQFLVEHGANVNALGGCFGSALQAASYKGNINIVQLLVELGANINVPGGMYHSALGAALYQGHEDIVCLLRERGAQEPEQDGKFPPFLMALT
jgi:hypothetical protein